MKTIFAMDADTTRQVQREISPWPKRRKSWRWSIDLKGGTSISGATKAMNIVTLAG
jgi:hypothetical protein